MEPEQPVRLGPRGTLYLMVKRRHRDAAVRWFGRILAAGIGAGLLSLVRYLGGF